ncbi:MAG: acetyl-CoA hydrolase/transferase family protein [Firmicutes bacterium]|nr:acetyl-CoA hydrolase/transferase family protein [Bacillota bacterium]
MGWQEEYQRKIISMEAAAQMVRSGDNVATALGIGACSADFYNALLNRGGELTDVKFIDTVQVRPNKMYDPEFMAALEGRITHVPAFGMITIRKMHRAGLSDFYPATTTDAGAKMANKADFYIVMVTPPNRQGYVNLGLTNFYTSEAIRDGKPLGKMSVVVGEVNDQMPVIFGENWMHVSEFDHFVVNSTPIPAFNRGAPKEVEKRIGEYVLEMINDGDTIQMGLGGIPEAVVSGLEGKKDLGVLTEMLPIGLNQLVEKGIVTNARKPVHRGVTLATFCLGDQGLYDYARENPAVEFYPGSYTNNPAFIAQHPNMVAINMAMMADFSGQIASEGWGHRQVSGSGGQLDFMIGSYWSTGGRGITLMTAARQMPDGSLSSAIVPDLPPGTPITVPRTFAQYVVTEFGVASLKYKTRRERAEELISIAHPDLRGELRKSLKKVFYPRS